MIKKHKQNRYQLWSQVGRQLSGQLAAHLKADLMGKMMKQSGHLKLKHKFEDSLKS